MRRVLTWAIVGGFFFTGCYSTKEVLNNSEEPLSQGADVRQVTTADGEQIEFTDFFGDYGVVKDSLVTGVTELQGPVRIPLAKVSKARVRELNVFGTVLGVAGLATASYLLLNAVLGSSSSSSTGSSTGTSSSGGGGG